MMMQSQREKKSLLLSLLLHTIILTVFIVSFNSSSRLPVTENSDQKTNMIEALVVDALPPAPKPKQTVAPPPILKAEPDPQKLEPKPTVAMPVKKTIAIPLDHKLVKKHQQDKIAQQLLSDLKQQAQLKKKIKSKEIATAFKQELKQLSAKSNAAKLQHDKLLSAEREQKTQGEINKYKALILQAISQQWKLPSAIDKKLMTELLIYVAPGGVVLEVQILKSSGNEALDHSARTAVLKASPLPVPADSDAFESFRRFVLKVKPENILTNDSWLN